MDSNSCKQSLLKRQQFTYDLHCNPTIYRCIYILYITGTTTELCLLILITIAMYQNSVHMTLDN